MSKRPLRDQINEFYHSKRPSTRMIKDLKSMVEERNFSERTMKNREWGWRFQKIFNPKLALASALAVILGIAYVTHDFKWFRSMNREGTGLTRAVTSEIALNHHKQLDIEFLVQTYSQLQKQMKKLDFSIVEPVNLKGKNLSLLGARYCSIQGQIAVQIKLTDDSGKNYTLYQTRLTRIFDELRDIHLNVDGLRIDLWQEKGLLIGLAKN